MTAKVPSNTNETGLVRGDETVTPKPSTMNVRVSSCCNVVPTLGTLYCALKHTDDLDDTERVVRTLRTGGRTARMLQRDDPTSMGYECDRSSSTSALKRSDCPRYRSRERLKLTFACHAGPLVPQNRRQTPTFGYLNRSNFKDVRSRVLAEDSTSRCI